MAVVAEQTVASGDIAVHDAKGAAGGVACLVQGIEGRRELTAEATHSDRRQRADPSQLEQAHARHIARHQKRPLATIAVGDLKQIEGFHEPLMLQPQPHPGFVAEAFVVVRIVAQAILQNNEAP